MAEKKHDRRELMARSMDAEKAKGQSREDMESEFMESVTRDSWVEEDSFREAIKSTPFGDRLIDIRSEIRDLDCDGQYVTSKCHSFRFDAGDGFVLDISTATPCDDPLDLTADRAAGILENALRIVPFMRDGVELEADNAAMDYDSAADLFKTSPPGTAYSGSWYFHHNRPEDLGTFDGMDVRRLRYFDGARCEPVDGDFHSVRCGGVHAIFPRKPSEDDLKWVSGIKPTLGALSNLVASGSVHFVLWRDGSKA